LLFRPKATRYGSRRTLDESAARQRGADEKRKKEVEQQHPTVPLPAVNDVLRRNTPPVREIR
jgi:hypothetical protein